MNASGSSSYSFAPKLSITFCETGGFDLAIARPLAGLPSGQSMSAALPFSASLKTLFVALPCSQTPGGPPRQTISAFQCCPRYS